MGGMTTRQFDWHFECVKCTRRIGVSSECSEEQARAAAIEAHAEPVQPYKLYRDGVFEREVLDVYPPCPEPEMVLMGPCPVCHWYCAVKCNMPGCTGERPLTPRTA